MNSVDFDRVTTNLVDSCLDILKIGASEYAGDEDRLKNFKGVADKLHISPEEVCMVYMLKHIDGISTYITNRKIQRDSIYGRITDAINYLILLNAILLESSSIPSGNSKTPFRYDSLSNQSSEGTASPGFIQANFSPRTGERAHNPYEPSDRGVQKNKL